MTQHWLGYCTWFVSSMKKQTSRPKIKELSCLDSTSGWKDKYRVFTKSNDVTWTLEWSSLLLIGLHSAEQTDELATCVTASEMTISPTSHVQSDVTNRRAVMPLPDSPLTSWWSQAVASTYKSNKVMSTRSTRRDGKNLVFVTFDTQRWGACYERIYAGDVFQWSRS